MTCLHDSQRVAGDSWPDENLESIHKTQSDPEWVKRELSPQVRDSFDRHRLQTYRMAIRQELRRRGLAVLRPM